MLSQFLAVGCEAYASEELRVICKEIIDTEISIFFGGGRGSNPEPSIYYALFLPTELSLRRHTEISIITT